MPPGAAGVLVDMGRVGAALEQPDGIFARLDAGELRVVRQACVVGARENDFATASFPAVETALVHQPVMVPAKQHEVIEARLAAVGPVADMVAVDELRVSAARLARRE